MVEHVCAALAREPLLHSVHLAGGEATLRFELLLSLVRVAVKYDVPLSYLETNASWCADREETRDRLLQLKSAGLPALLVSASMFHLEFVPFVNTRNCVEVGHEVFGSDNTIIWLPHTYRLLAQLPDERRTWSLPEFCHHFGLELDDSRLPGLYQVIPGGRAPEALRNCYERRPPEAFRHDRCNGELFSATHFHIDLYGNLFTGFCAGLAAGTVDELHPEITPERFPLTNTLCEKGPYGLSDLAIHEHGFTPRQDGYVSKCDLCYNVRQYLHETGSFEELRPADYYQRG